MSQLRISAAEIALAAKLAHLAGYMSQTMSQPVRPPSPRAAAGPVTPHPNGVSLLCRK